MGAVAAIAIELQALERIRRHLPVPDPVEAPLASIRRPVLARHQVRERGMSRALLKREALAQLVRRYFRKFRFGHEASPCHVSCIRRRYFGQYALAYGRTRTIGSNQQICAFSVTARKPRDDLFAIDYMTRK